MRNKAWTAITTSLRRLFRRGDQPPPGGVREPRRPRPTRPAASVALAEPRVRLWHRLRLSRPS